jgi:hypothetical protein
MCGTEIGGVRDCKCLENTPWETLDDATDEEHLQASREEWDADRRGHKHHAGNHRLLVSDPLGDVAVDDQTENATNLLELALRSASLI